MSDENGGKRSPRSGTGNKVEPHGRRFGSDAVDTLNKDIALAHSVVPVPQDRLATVRSLSRFDEAVVDHARGKGRGLAVYRIDLTIQRPWTIS